jgi:hypothetical protein
MRAGQGAVSPARIVPPDAELLVVSERVLKTLSSDRVTAACCDRGKRLPRGRNSGSLMTDFWRS